MIPRVTGAKHVHDYVLELTFSDGASGQIDFRGRIVGRGGVFQPLEDITFFRQFRVDSDFGTLIWPNDVDFCPDVLHGEVCGKTLSNTG